MSDSVVTRRSAPYSLPSLTAPTLSVQAANAQEISQLPAPSGNPGEDNDFRIGGEVVYTFRPGDGSSSELEQQVFVGVLVALIVAVVMGEL